MARDFGGSNDALLYNSGAVVTAAPLAMCCWFNPDTLGNSGHMISVGLSGSSNDRFTLISAGSVANDPVRFQSRAGGTSANVDTTTGYTVGGWHHACGIEESATKRYSYIDGGSEGTETTSTTPSSLVRTRLGASTHDVTSNEYNGKIAEAAIWDLSVWPGGSNAAKVTAWKDTCLAALAGKVAPCAFPLGLVAYWPLHGNLDPEPDYFGDAHLTKSGDVTKSDHCPIIYPAAWNRTGFSAAGAAPAPSINPPMFHAF